MKNFIYISLLSLGIFATSCSKDEVVMSNANIDAVPTWDNSPNEKKGGPVSDDSGDQDNSGTVTGPGQSGSGGTPPTLGDITDPNNDPDGKKKKH